MNDDWLHKVHDRMSDYEIDEPENLWNAIESKRAESSSDSRKVVIWVKRSIAAAALVALVLSVGVYLANVKQDVSQTRLLTEATETAVVGPQNPIPEPVVRNTTPKNFSQNLIARNNIPASIRCVESSSAQTVREKSDAPVEELPSGNTECLPGPEDNTLKQTHPSEERMRLDKENISSLPDNNHLAAIRPKAAAANNVSVSVYSSEGAGSALNYSSKGNSIVSTTGPDESAWVDSPKLGILLFNQGKDIQTEIKHRLPIRAGISFAYNFNERFSIESGVAYSLLISDIREGSDSHYYTGRQKLQYIGIPLNLKYRVFSWKRFDLYASTGALAEKCVSATIDKEFILDYRKKDSQSDDLSHKPLQWSVNVSAGAQYNLINSMSIFVEPGLSYYFNDGTDIRTIYKEKPLNFNLNMGVRFTFGK